MQIYLAPMEGITTYLYRNAFHRFYGGIDKYFTPFLANKNFSHRELNDILPEHNRGIRLVPQILANQPETFLTIASKLSGYGYQEVNLNLGCPSGTVVSKKRGAGFLSVPSQLDEFLSEIFEKCMLKISLKTRIGIDSIEEWEHLSAIFSKYPIEELIIHTRLQKDFYSGRTHPEAFMQAQESCFVPLCYNGDIISPASLEELDNLGISADTVMLGRGAIANPGLPMALKEKSSAKARDLKTFEAFHDEILAGYTETMSGDNPVLFHMKELWVYMGAYLGLSGKQVKKLQKATRLKEYRELVHSYITQASLQS